MRARALAVAAVLATSLAACGDNRFPIDLLAAQAIEANCDRAVRCGLYHDVNSCLSDQHLGDFEIPPFVVHLQDPAVLAAVGSGTMTYDESVAPGCMAALAAMSCSRASEDLRVDDPIACAGLFTGQIAVSGPCVFDDECSSGRCTPAATCESDYVCCIGTCATAPHTAALGAACMIDSDCTVDAFCSGAGCHALLAAGATCSTSAECGFDLVCNTPSPGSSGVCATAPLIGEPCVDSACAEVGARCGSDGMCVALTPPGQPCTDTFDCSEDFVCSGSGACARAPALGEQCTSICLPGSWCNNPDGAGGICDAPLPDTEECDSPEQCQSGYCADGDFAETCIERPVCF